MAKASVESVALGMAEEALTGCPCPRDGLSVSIGSVLGAAQCPFGYDPCEQALRPRACGRLTWPPCGVVVFDRQRLHGLTQLLHQRGLADALLSSWSMSSMPAQVLARTQQVCY